MALSMRRQAHQNSRYSAPRQASWSARSSSSSKRAPFQEIEGAAFFLGKLNKNHDREVVYNALRKLTHELDFYIRKLDMPYACNHTKRGNQGYAFVHTNSKEQADRIVAMKAIHLGKQVCEVKAYAGRPSVGKSAVSPAPTSGYNSPMRVENSFVNPLKEKSQAPPAWGKNTEPIVNILRKDGMSENNVKLEEEIDQSSTSDLSESGVSFDSETSLNNAERTVHAKCATAMANGMSEEQFCLLYEQWYAFIMDTLSTLPTENVDEIAATLNC
jgi:hypothetical protein